MNQSVQSLSLDRLFVTPWTAACQASLSFTISQSLFKLMSMELVMPSNHLVLCHPLLLLPSIFPSIRVFSNEPALCVRWPKYCSFTSASVLPMNIQDSFPLGLTGLISLQAKDSQEPSPTPQFRSINSLSLSSLYGPTLTSIHDYRKNQCSKKETWNTGINKSNRSDVSSSQVLSNMLDDESKSRGIVPGESQGQLV